MNNATPTEWKQLLTLLLAQRLEINAMESALKQAGILTEGQIKEIRAQTLNTAKAWSSEQTDDVWKLITIHAPPGATMLVPPATEE